MFLNFLLTLDLRNYDGIMVKDPTKNDKQWMRSVRMTIGLCNQPHDACRMYAIVSDTIRGCPSEVNNSFDWVKIQFKLPGLAIYNPGDLWVSKVKFYDNEWILINDFKSYVDHIRTMDLIEWEWWCITRVITSLYQSFGIHDALRKRRPLSRSLGAWTGAMVSTRDGSGCRLFSTNLSDVYISH